MNGWEAVEGKGPSNKQVGEKCTKFLLTIRQAVLVEDHVSILAADSYHKECREFCLFLIACRLNVKSSSLSRSI